ncbi:CU044_2847 family protein [Streptomyces sp. TRM 70361]|uniref:CU044_2847 family protein n=1 Tax=Streptomyces sp. TRM 70361 TaxID=3116553 RepID=UPI002E7B3A16|nr:CU044_2847 family protein [Streptomyces sp. TRM 70361]MEE1938816.1 CU044_2847 family protein [Streptomyces sp. TRM 70361]
MERTVQEIELPGGERVLARIGVLGAAEGDLPALPAPDDEPEYAFRDVGAVDHLAGRVVRLNELITGVGTAVLDAARALRPDEVAATFGVELVARSGRAVAVLADGEAKASLSVTLTWRPGDGGPGGAGGTGGASGGAGE